MASIRVVTFAAIVLISLPGLLLAQTKAPAPQITNLAVISIHPGMNTLPRFAPDGRDVAVLSAWRDNGNAHGYTKFVIMIPKAGEDGRASWGIVGIEDHKEFFDSTSDSPHTGEDYVRSVRFARGRVNGEAASLLITAELDTAKGFGRPSQSKISVYRMIQADEGFGTTPFFFKLAREASSKKLYCNSELALTKELGVPLSRDYGGPNEIDGCVR